MQPSPNLQISQSNINQSSEKTKGIQEMKNVQNLWFREWLALHKLLDLLVQITARIRGYRIDAHLASLCFENRIGITGIRIRDNPNPRFRDWFRSSLSDRA